MLKRQLNQSSLFIVLAIAILAVSFLPVLVVAKGQDILINLGEIEGDFNKEGVQFDLWYVSENPLSEKDSLALRDKLEKLDIETLNENYPNHFTSGPTDAEGKLLLKLPNDGAYYVRQHLAENVEGDVVAPFVLSIPSESTEVRPKTIANRKLEIKKVDNNGNPIAGAVFEVYQMVDGKPVKIGFTDGKYDPNSKGTSITIDGADGTIILKNLPEGDYFLREVQAPSGYELSSKEIPFTIKNGQVTELVVLNKKIKGTTGEHRFLKYDGDTNRPLAGALFKVAVKNEETGKYVDILRDGKLYTVQSNENGEFKVEGLTEGEYVLIEIRSPEGYVIDSEPIPFKIDENSNLERLDIANFKGINIPGEKPTEPLVPPPTTPEKPLTPPPITPEKPSKPSEPSITPEKPLTPKTPQTTTPSKPLAGRGTIPKTGDVSLLIAMVGGGIMVGMGINFIKREDE